MKKPQKSLGEQAGEMVGGLVFLVLYMVPTVGAIFLALAAVHFITKYW